LAGAVFKSTNRTPPLPFAGGWTPVVKHEIVLQHRRNPDDHSGMLPSGEKKRKRTSIAAPEKRSLEAYFAVQPRYFGQPIEYIEKGRAVLYRDFVTILRGALMQYVTKSETPAPTPPPNYNMMYLLDEHVWPVKILMYIDTVARPLGRMHSPVRYL
jgi:hypothetical protein